MNMKNFFKILIITFTVFTLSVGFFGVANAASNLFRCNYRSGGGASDCYVDTSTTDCDGGKVVDESICDEFDDRPSLCNGAAGHCIASILAPCDTDSECINEKVCYRGGCILPSSIPCDADSDCRDGYICSLLGTCAPSSEQNNNSNPGSGGNIISLPNPLASDNFEDFITSLIRSLTVIASPILVLMIVWGGFTFVVSGGKPEKAKKGRDIIKYAIIGFVIIVFAWIIVAILRGIL